MRNNPPHICIYINKVILSYLRNYHTRITDHFVDNVLISELNYLRASLNFGLIRINRSDSKSDEVRNVDESLTVGSVEPSSKPFPVVADGSLHGFDADEIPEHHAVHLISPVSHSARDCDRHYLVVVDFAVAISQILG